MPDRVFLTGGSGFVGSAILSELLVRGYSVNALTHRGKLPVASPQLHESHGDLFDPGTLDSAMAGCDAVIHLIGVIMEKPSKGITFERMHFEATRRMVDATRRNNINRYIQMSALGTRPDGISDYHRTKWKAEQYVRESTLNWTIFRPSLIHGPGGFMQMEARWARKSAPPFLAMPYFGKGLLGLSGSGLLQPVFIQDVARAFVDAIDTPASIHKTYDLAGPERFTWPQFHEASAQEIVGKHRLAAPLPAWFAKLLASAGLGPLLDFSRDQVIMSQEDNTGDPQPFETDFGWKLQPFRSTLSAYAGELK